MNAHRHYCKRDERGWRVPRPGTVSRQVYGLLLAGGSQKRITEITGRSYATIGVLIWRIRNDTH